MYHSTDISSIWQRFNTKILDLISFFDSETDAVANAETARIILDFYKELHHLLQNTNDYKYQWNFWFQENSLPLACNHTVK